jgi:prolyl 4-hydroxylase
MDMQARAAAGDTQAQIALARQHQNDGRHDLARGWFARAAQSGDLGAMHALAASLLTEHPIMMRDGAEMMRVAAGRGDAEASRICAFIAGQSSDDLAHWTEALDYLAQAASQGSGLAQDELLLLTAASAPPQLWAELARSVAVAALVTPPPSQIKFENPRIGICEGFASAAECDWLMARAAPRLKAAELYDPVHGGGFRQDSIRNNRDAHFNILQSDLVLLLLQSRIARMMQLPVDDMEPPMVLQYRPGQHFSPHRDGLDSGSPALAREIAAKGQRVATVLLYLNDDYSGGETEFPELHWRLKGRKGDVLWFWNVDDQGRLAEKSLHAGLAPLDGEKWLLSQWIRAR